jgi:hypothetical protein
MDQAKDCIGYTLQSIDVVPKPPLKMMLFDPVVTLGLHSAFLLVVVALSMAIYVSRGRNRTMCGTPHIPS